MALNLTNLFTALGRIGRNAYLIASGQQLQSVPFGELSGFSYIDPSWINQLTQGYDGAIRASSGGMSAWTQAAQQILMKMVAAENPAYGVSLPASLSFLLSEMVAQAATVKKCTIGVPTVVADAANVGSGSLFITTTRGDGLSLQNIMAEETVLLLTSDSYTGGATRGQEPWQWSGAPNVSSLTTGQGVSLWDWDWPQGSGFSASGRCIAANSYANVSGNYLTNGDFATWTGGTPALSYWNLLTGAWGTDAARDGTNQLGGTYCVKFLPTATLTCLEQQFNSTTVTGVGAGTPAALTPFNGYALNLWLKGSAALTGILTVAFVDSAGTTLNDQSGSPASATLNLNTVTTSYAGYNFALRLPVVLPADGIVRLRIKITTALSGGNLFMDEVAFCRPTNLYPGGANLAMFSNPAAPFEAIPDPDGFTITFSNDRAGASFGATWQTLLNRLYQAPGLIVPYTTGVPTILDSLITNA